MSGNVPVGVGRMLGRALRRRCPRCASGHLFRRWFEMVRVCPGCGYRFEARPEDGFFFGAFTVNLTVTLGVLLLGIFAYIAALAAGHPPPLVPALAAAAVVAVVLPVVFYPYARTIWAACEAALGGMDDAVSRRRGGRGPAREDGPPPPDGRR